MDGIGSIAAAAMGMGKGLGDLITGWRMGKQAKKLAGLTTEQWKEKRGVPEYTTPESYTDYLGQMRTRARQQMPGYGQQRQAIESATASTVGSAQNLGGADMAAVLLGAGQDRLRALRQLGIAASQWQSQAQQQAARATLQGAQYEDQAFQYNQLMPWGIQQNEIAAARGAAMQTMQGGWDAFMGAGTQAADLTSQQMWYDRMYPGWGATQNMQPTLATPYNNQPTGPMPAQTSPYPPGSMGGFSGPNTYTW